MFLFHPWFVSLTELCDSRWSSLSDSRLLLSNKPRETPGDKIRAAATSYQPLLHQFPAAQEMKEQQLCSDSDAAL